jgi:4-carboxymuconolactone decarboxylase
VTDRLPMPATLDDAQRAARDAIVTGPRGALVGPFVPLLRAPVLMNRVQELGAHLRFESSLRDDLRELVILQVARDWDQEFEWGHHHPIALSAGLPASVVESVAARSEPVGADPEVRAVWQLVRELLATHQVSDGAYSTATALLGERGVVEVVTTAGYYTTLAMVMNTARTPPDPDGPRLNARGDAPL